MKNKIVIGCGFGDESKGLTTHNLCDSGSLVVRFSGGQQAGHTVIHNKIKHIFSNFGAGTMKGCPTFFTEDTCIYPKTITREWGELKSKGFDPKLYVAPLAKVTTPYDVWAGRIKEKKVRHGSCGLGIGATMKRNEGPVKLYAVDLAQGNTKILKQRLEAIRNYYDFTEESLEQEDWEIFQNDLDSFEEAIEDKKFEVQKFQDLPYFSNFIFEGSQGILLDMNHGAFPNVTYASTTSKNAWKYTDCAEVFYATRCYHTRHGNGPFEEKELNLINNQEEINVYNQWQGEFKIGELDYSLLKYAINVDRVYHKDSEINLVVSCLDQRPGFKFDKAALGIYFEDTYGNYSAESGNLRGTYW